MSDYGYYRGGSYADSPDGAGGALFRLEGELPTNSTWDEYIYFQEEGASLDISDFDWKLTLRSCGRYTTAFRTLSIDTGELSIVSGDDDVPSILRVNLDDGDLNSYEGDVIADLASQDSTGKVVLWAHGVISLRPNPVSF